MWGAALHDCATHIHRPLFATALSLSTAEAAPPRVILTLDLCIIGANEMREIMSAVSAELGLLEESQLVVTLSHTHAGAGILSRSANFASLPGGQHISPYLDTIVAACVEVSRRAVAAREPAWVTAAKASCNLACNRDTWDSTGVATAPPGAGTSSAHVARSTVPGQWVCGYGADSVQGPADDTLMVARVCRRLTPGQPQQPDFSGKTLATGVSGASAEAAVLAVLFNYGCHPTSLGPGNMHISPDYIGAARELLEEQFGGHALFLQGASGDTGPMISYAADPAAADRNGRVLGYAAAAAVAGMLPPGTGLAFDGAIVSGATLGGWRESRLPADAVRPCLPACLPACSLHRYIVRTPVYPPWL
jgi:hypothetical protein